MLAVQPIRGSRCDEEPLKSGQVMEQPVQLMALRACRCDCYD